MYKITELHGLLLFSGVGRLLFREALFKEA